MTIKFHDGYEDKDDLVKETFKLWHTLAIPEFKRTSV